MTMTPPEASRHERRKVIVVLPAFNEEATIERLLDRIDEALDEASIPYQVIVVDDGSHDRTRAIVQACAARMPIRVVQHEVNRGLGATIRDGLITAAEQARARDIIVTMDADDTHTPGLILRMVRMISEGHDVVIASRYQPGSRTIGVPFARRVLSDAGSWLFRLVFPTPGVRDFTCGYRAYRAEVVQKALERYGAEFLDQDGFQCMVDILLKLRRMDLVFGEVPFVLRYDYKEGGSKMNVLRTVGATLALLLKRRFGD